MRPTKEESKNTEAVFPKKAMKDRKKKFLKEKKQRKRGKSITGEVDDEDQAAEDRERKIMTDTTRPAFGEQAQQPIKVMLPAWHFRSHAFLWAMSLNVSINHVLLGRFDVVVIMRVECNGACSLSSQLAHKGFEATLGLVARGELSALSAAQEVHIQG